VSYTTDDFGNANAAGYFDGVNDWLEILDSGDITMGREATVAFKFNTEVSTMQDIINKAQYSNAGGIQFEVEVFASSIHGNNNLFFGTEHNNSCSVVNLASHYIFADSATITNRWYCVLMTFDSGVKRMYVNGHLAAEDTVTGFINNTGMDSCQSALKVGVWWQNYPWWYKGKVDEVRIYDRVLNTQELDSFCTYNSVKALAIENKKAIENNFKLYPNPANGNTLNIAGVESTDGATIRVTDQLGRMVLKQDLSAGNTIDIGKLPAGNYFVELNTAEQRYYRKFVKL
jgi:hypothetical protein